MNDQTAVGFYERYWQFRIERGDHAADNRIKLRHEQTRDFLQQQYPDSAGIKVIDLGCGDGLLAQSLAGLNFDLTGADISTRALSLSEHHYAHTFTLDLDTEPTPAGLNDTFDAVACLEVLEHLERPQQNIARSFDLCKPGGVAVFSFPNIFSWKNRFAFALGRWPKGYTTYDPREHLQVFELREFRHWVTDAGFHLLGTAITPDLPAFRPFRRAMFKARGLLNRIGPSLWGMQINVMARKPDHG